MLDVIRILQFGDSVLPVGSFSFSNGLESAVQSGIVHDRDSLKEFVNTAFDQAATCDGIAILAAFRGWRAGQLEDVISADEAVFQSKLNEEMRTMTVRMGRKLIEMALHVMGRKDLAEWLKLLVEGRSPGTYPVCQGIVFASLGLKEKDAFVVHQYGVASMMISAALRLMKLHYLDAQAVMYEVNSRVESLYKRVADLTLDDMCTFAPVMDILSAVHVKSNIRMFMN